MTFRQIFGAEQNFSKIAMLLIVVTRPENLVDFIIRPAGGHQQNELSAIDKRAGLLGAWSAFKINGNFSFWGDLGGRVNHQNANLKSCLKMATFHYRGGGIKPLYFSAHFWYTVRVGCKGTNNDLSVFFCEEWELKWALYLHYTIGDEVSKFGLNIFQRGNYLLCEWVYMLRHCAADLIWRW